ncbi:MAG: CDP-diacylglycerol--glycerol-3-phosphate 3-phosphatidyltransferase [Treponema sp.]|nr:CDP-diacylglycerol--glycerol-3-phosphate 3-phosphatidyltransferase [Treponema sp.]
MKMSNRFTMTRIIFAPIFFLLYFIPIWTHCFVRESVFILIPLLAFGEFTDFLDGFFARRHNEVSDFGKLFDPFADVVLHLTTLCCFMLPGYDKTVNSGLISPIVFLLIMYREFGMTFVRMIATKKGIAIAARKGGKFKTVLYVVVGFYCLFLESLTRLDVLPASFTALKLVATVLSICAVVACYSSFLDYLVHFGSVFSGEASDTGKK